MTQLDVPTRFPGATQAVRELVNAHLKLKDEPLLLAVYFAPTRDPQDIFLLEVIRGFGRNTVDEDRRMMEVAYAANQTLGIPTGSHLRLLLTNVPEIEVAIGEDWDACRELRAAVARGNATCLHATEEGERIWKLLQ